MSQQERTVTKSTFIRGKDCSMPCGRFCMQKVAIQRQMRAGKEFTIELAQDFDELGGLCDGGSWRYDYSDGSSSTEKA